MWTNDRRVWVCIKSRPAWAGFIDRENQGRSTWTRGEESGAVSSISSLPKRTHSATSIHDRHIKVQTHAQDAVQLLPDCSSIYNTIMIWIDRKTLGSATWRHKEASVASRFAVITLTARLELSTSAWWISVFTAPLIVESHLTLGQRTCL